MAERPLVTTVLPRRFALIRHVDYTGVSGIGVVAYGIAFSDGHVVLRWCSAHPATSVWESLDHLLAVHGHGEATSIQWIDAPVRELEELPGTSRTGRRARRRAALRAGASHAKAPEAGPDSTRAVEPADEPTAERSGGIPVVADAPPSGEGEPRGTTGGRPNGYPWPTTAPLIDSSAGAESGAAVPRPGGPGRHRRSDQEVPR